MIALIVGYTLYRQRKLQQQQEVDIKSGQAVENYERRKSRMWVFMRAAIAAVIVVCMAICGIMKWNAGAEQRQIAKAEKQRLEKLNEDEFSAWVDDNYSCFSKMVAYQRFNEYKEEKINDLQQKINQLDAEKAELKARWEKNRDALDIQARTTRDSVYYSCLSSLLEQQEEVVVDINKVEQESFASWQEGQAAGSFLWLFVWLVLTFVVCLFLINQAYDCDAWVYWLSYVVAAIFFVVKLLLVGLSVGTIMAWSFVLFFVFLGGRGIIVHGFVGE